MLGHQIEILDPVSKGRICTLVRLSSDGRVVGYSGWSAVIASQLYALAIVAGVLRKEQQKRKRIEKEGGKYQGKKDQQEYPRLEYSISSCLFNHILQREKASLVELVQASTRSCHARK